jgi:hypothetical protein
MKGIGESPTSVSTSFPLAYSWAGQILQNKANKNQNPSRKTKRVLLLFTSSNKNNHCNQQYLFNFKPTIIQGLELYIMTQC